MLCLTAAIYYGVNQTLFMSDFSPVYTDYIVKSETTYFLYVHLIFCVSLRFGYVGIVIVAVFNIALIVLSVLMIKSPGDEGISLK